MYPGELPKITHWCGDLWTDGYRHFGPILDEALAPIAAPCLCCKFKFRSKLNDSLIYTLSSNPTASEGRILVTNPTTYVFDIPDQALNLSVGDYIWTLETYRTADASDAPITLFTGELAVEGYNQ